MFWLVQCLHGMGAQAACHLSARVCSCFIPSLAQAVAYFPPHQAQLTHALARWASAAMWVVKFTVRPAAAGQLRDELMGVLQPQELDWLLAQPHMPLALGQVWHAGGAMNSVLL